MNWIILALSASMLWGATYVLQEIIFTKINVTSYLTIISFFSFLIMASIGLMNGTLLTNLKTVYGSKQIILWMALAIVIYVAAELSIGYSIDAKNASLAGIIEITYPIFILLFSLLLLGRVDITWGSVFGSITILIGVAIIMVTDKI